MRRAFIAVFLASIMAVSGIAFAQDSSFKLIGNPSTTPDSMSKRDLERIFLKKKKKWPNSQPAHPVDQRGNNALRTRFSEEVLGKSLAMVESHWQAQVFSGKGTPPKQLTSDAAIIDFVRKTRGAVGYVSAGTSTEGVKVINIID
ncbi:MAG: phosphate ABC transporter substrate-binding protein [bacterium]|nr:phosphate ABC transporter substrate-binding protein [bacterium]